MNLQMNVVDVKCVDVFKKKKKKWLFANTLAISTWYVKLCLQLVSDAPKWKTVFAGFKSRERSKTCVASASHWKKCSYAAIGQLA